MNRARWAKALGYVTFGASSLFCVTLGLLVGWIIGTAWRLLT